MEEPETILALDISKRSTGIGFGPPGRLPVLSCTSFANWEQSTIAEQSRAAIIWINDALNIYEPDLVVVEAALIAGRQSNDQFARFALGVCFLVAGACLLRGVRHHEVNRGTWTKFALGHGNLPSGEAKTRSLAIARQMGLNPSNDDEADAANIHFWASQHFAGKRNDAMLPIFAAAKMRAFA